MRDGSTVLTFGGSRVVGAVLQAAADNCMGSVRFRVIYVLGPNERNTPSSSSSSANGNDRSQQHGKPKMKEPESYSTNDKNAPEGRSIVSTLRARGVPVATIPDSAVGFALGKVDMVIAGAEGVVESGGIISRLGTYQIGMLAKATGKPFYVVAESHKFVRLYPLGQYDMPIEQRVVQFRVGDDDDDDDDNDNDGERTDESQMNKHDKSTSADAGTKSSAFNLDGAQPTTMTIREKERAFSKTMTPLTTIPANDLRDAVDFTVRYSFIIVGFFHLFYLK